MSTEENSVNKLSEELRASLLEFRFSYWGKLRDSGYSNFKLMDQGQFDDYLFQVNYVTANLCIGTRPPILILKDIQFNEPLKLPGGFYETLELTRIRFLGGVTFEGVEVNSQTILNDIAGKDSPSSIVAFNNCVFRGEFNFDQANNISLQLVKSSFYGIAAMSNILDIARINGIHFYNAAVFNNSTITLDSIDAQFDAVVNFDNAVFSEGTIFSPFTEKFNTRFFFRDSIFKSWVDFSGVTFGQHAIFNGTEFFNSAVFTGAKISGDADFDNTTFMNETSFEKCEFGSAPTFHESKLHSNTSLVDAVYSSFGTDGDRRAFRRLRDIAASFRWHDDEAKFFSYEQRANCNLLLAANSWSLEGSISKLYDRISNYGQNIVFPFYWLAGITAYFILVFYVSSLSDGSVVHNVTLHSWSADAPSFVGLAVQNIFNPVAFTIRETPYMPGNWWVAALSILQSLLTLSVLALWFLAIRRKFRKSTD